MRPVNGTSCRSNSVIRPACRGVSALPLDPQRLPAGTRALRLTTNQEIYWDRLAIVWAEPLPDVRRQPLELLAAQVCEAGFARRADSRAAAA